MAKQVFHNIERMEDRVIERDHVLLILKHMIDVIEKGETSLILKAETSHTPTHIGKINGWDEWREGNRSFMVSVKENATREYYLFKYGIEEKPRPTFLEKIKSLFN